MTYVKREGDEYGNGETVRNGWVRTVKKEKLHEEKQAMGKYARQRARDRHCDMVCSLKAGRYEKLPYAARESIFAHFCK